VPRLASRKWRRRAFWTQLSQAFQADHPLP
jgi:hypothetical protein